MLLAKILKRGGNVLILDEPTNDLDLGTLRLLEEALVAFAGSVIVVSHDRYFLNRVCTAILAFEGEGVLRYNVGNYDYYLGKKSAEATTIKSEPSEPVEPAAPRPAFGASSSIGSPPSEPGTSAPAPGPTASAGSGEPAVDATDLRAFEPVVATDPARHHGTCRR